MLHNVPYYIFINYRQTSKLFLRTHPLIVPQIYHISSANQLILYQRFKFLVNNKLISCYKYHCVQPTIIVRIVCTHKYRLLTVIC